jgi:FHS family glucose/mannose:H+ symporter-like MFS transporter
LAFLGAGELTYSFLPAWPFMLAAAPLAGFGFGMVEAAIGSLVIELAASNKAVAMSRLEVFFGLGALAMPAIAGGLIAIGIWYSAFPLIVLMTAVTAILWMRLSFGSLNTALDRKAGKEASAEERRSSRSLPLLGMMIAFFVLYVGTEMSIVNFLPSLLTLRSQAAPAEATLGITVFWATMSIGRMFAGSLAERAGYSRYLHASTFAALLLLLLFSFSTALWSSFAVILMLGLAMSGIFAIALVFANSVVDGAATRTTSLLVASGGVGGALLPRLSGWCLDHLSARSTQLLLAVCALVMLLILSAAARTSRKSAGLLQREQG